MALILSTEPKQQGAAAAASGPTLPSSSPASLPMLAPAWNLLRTTLRDLLYRDVASAARVRTILEGWKTCPDPIRKVRV